MISLRTGVREGLKMSRNTFIPAEPKRSAPTSSVGLKVSHSHKRLTGGFLPLTLNQYPNAGQVHGGCYYETKIELI